MGTLNNTETNLVYSPQGASLLNGIQAGNFFVPANNINPGISIGNALLAPLTFFTSQLIYSAITVPANSSIYVKLFQLNDQINPSTKAATVVSNGQESYVQLTSPTALYIDTDAGSINWFVSGEDVYDQRMTYGNDPATPITELTGNFFMPRCISKIRSIKLTNVSGESATVDIGVGGIIELPYFNFGTGAHITGIFSGDYSFMVAANAPGTAGVPVAWNFVITNPAENPLETGLTLSTGTVRPYISFEVSEEVVGFPTEIIGKWVFVQQAVFGFGTLPGWIDEDLRPELINNKISILGGNQYAENYVGWQG